MRIENMAKAMAIIAKHEPKSWPDAEHDQIWAGSRNDYPADDLAQLAELEAEWDEDIERWKLLS